MSLGRGMGEISQFGDLRDTRTLRHDSFGGDIKLTVNVHHGEFHFIPLRFDKSVGFDVEFYEQGSTPLDVINPLEEQGTLSK